MKHWKFLLLGCGLTISSSSFAMVIPENFQFFGGVDYQSREMGFEEAFGGNLFKKHLSQYDAYLGMRFCNYFGLSVGYQESENKNRTTVLNAGDSYLGVTILPGDGFENHYTETKVKGAHIDLMGFLPICPCYNIDLLASVGVIRNKLNLLDITTALNNELLVEPLVRTYDEKHTHARASIGVQKTFFEHLGFRALINWENTKRFRDLKPLEVPHADTNVKAKNSLIYSIGIFLIT